MIYLIALLTIIHTNLSNSAFGLNTNIFSIALFSFVNLLIIYDFLSCKNINISNLIISVAMCILLSLWFFYPENKFYYCMLLNACITYYIIKKKYIKTLANILQIVIFISAVLMIFQISGISEFFHSWNSFYIEEFNNYFYRNIVINDILFNGFEEYNSNQVRPPGIFHSSAVLSMMLICFIVYIYNGFIKSQFAMFIIGYLIIFSGSKSVLAAFILFNFIQINFLRKNWFVIFSGILSAIIFHVILFPNLLVYNFDINFFFYSFDVRFQDFLNIKIGDFINDYFLILLSIIFSILTLYYIFIQYVNRNFFISILAISICLLTNNHLNNYLAGLFLFPLLWPYFE